MVLTLICADLDKVHMSFSAPNATAGARHSPLSGTVAGRFLIRGLLGAGGMGEVYRADDTRLKRPVALKRMATQLRADQHYRQRFLEEAQRASGLTGSHVAAIYDVVEEKGELLLVMEYVAGETLRVRLRLPFTLAEFLDIAVQCGDALVAAHSRGIVHCDLKPENIMLTTNGQIKILDFGVAKRLPHSGESSTIGNSDFVGGTSGYMSPEVLLEKPPDGRADIFSLGVIFYEALAGRHPFQTSSFVGTSDRILHESPPPLRSFNTPIPALLDDTIARMLAKDPAQRIASAAQLLGELRHLQQQSSSRLKIRFNAQRRSFRSIFGIAALAAAVLLLGYFASHMITRPLVKRTTKEPKYLAVLPFNSATQDRSSQAFSAGLTENLAARLGQLTTRDSVKVVPPSEVLAAEIKTADQARKICGAALVLEGSLLESGRLVRVSYSLVDAETRHQLQADTITTQANDPFALEDGVVSGVLNMLGREFQQNNHQLVVNHGTTEPAAYDFYLRGRGYLQEYQKPESIDSAITVFTHALERDPKYALAYAGLGEAYWHKYELTNNRGWLTKGGESCTRAISLQPALATGYTCLGVLDNGMGQYERAETEFLRAAELDPTSDDALRGLGSADQHLGKTTDAENAYQRAINLHPNYWADYNWLGGFYYTQARYDAAARMFARVVALAPDNERGYSNLGGVYLTMGRYADAVSAFQHSVAIRPTADAYSNLATAQFYSQQFAEAARTYEQAVKLSPGDYEMWGNLGDAYYWSPGEQAKAAPMYRKAISLGKSALQVNTRDAVIMCNLAIYHAMLRDKQPALSYLKDALQVSPTDPDFLFKAAEINTLFGSQEAALNSLTSAIAHGFSPYFVRNHPIFHNLSSDQRFQKLLENREISH
jgi:serine/threonine-protein kinase